MSALIAELGQAKKKKRPSMSNGSPAVVKVVKVAPVPDSTLQDLALFIDEATTQLTALDERIRSATDKYSDLLEYFIEDPNLESKQFFSTLHQFFTTFSDTRKRLQEQMRRQSLAQAQTQAQAKKTNLAQRRGSV